MKLFSLSLATLLCAIGFLPVAQAYLMPDQVFDIPVQIEGDEVYIPSLEQGNTSSSSSSSSASSSSASSTSSATSATSSPQHSAPTRSSRSGGGSAPAATLPGMVPRTAGASSAQPVPPVVPSIDLSVGAAMRSAQRMERMQNASDESVSSPSPMLLPPPSIDAAMSGVHGAAPQRPLPGTGPGTLLVIALALSSSLAFIFRKTIIRFIAS